MERYLEKIVVRDLFGYLNYNLEFSNDKPDPRPVDLLYGENGSGKTTIVQLLFAAIAPYTLGFRGRALKINFRVFDVHLRNGLRVTLSRNDKRLGAYRISAVALNSRISVEIGERENGLIKPENPSEYSKLIAILKEYCPNIIYLTDDRRLKTTIDSLKRDDSGRKAMSLAFGKQVAPQKSVHERNMLDATIVEKSVLDEFRRQAFIEGNIGQANSDSIYLEIAERISSNTTKPSDFDYSQFEKELNDIEISYKNIVATKLMAPIPFEKIRRILENTAADRAPDVARIVSPYLESATARINALRSPTDAMNQLVAALNEFFARKNLSFDVMDGFKIIAADLEPIDLSSLSSSERHLFLILCLAFLSRSQETLFIVDEPELSLNVYWQRKLPNALIELTKGAKVQFLMATHSLEILSEFGSRIVELEHTNAA